MFARLEHEHEAISASHQAKLHTQAYESLLSFRIALQRSLDLANKLPIIAAEEIIAHFPQRSKEEIEIGEEYAQLHSHLQTLQATLFECLHEQKHHQTSSPPLKRKLDNGNNHCCWNDILQVQESFEPFWAATLDKWHSRSHFGSEKVKQQLQVFNVSVWDNLQNLLRDDQRSLEKSRVPVTESDRMDLKASGLSSTTVTTTTTITTTTVAEEAITSSSSAKKQKKCLDEEVYDDRVFYAQLLKSFIAAHSSQSSSLSQEMMRRDDLAALKRFKQKKQSSLVDRKASKGRKIRYTVHHKLQNFMFPIPSSVRLQQGKEGGLGLVVDSERLFQSLFQ